MNVPKNCKKCKKLLPENYMKKLCPKCRRKKQ